MGAIVGVGMSRDVHGTARHEVTCPFGTHPKDASLSQRARTTSEAARSIGHVRAMVTREERGLQR